jgi:hypothetical protein
MAEFLIKLVLWLFVIILGIAFGAGLYEFRIVIPQWLRYSEGSGYRWDADAAREANTGLRFWVFVTTVPLTLLTLLSLGAPFWLQGGVRGWWLGAALAALVDRSMTFAYFIPTMLRLTRDETISQREAVATALQWVRLGHVRHAATLVAWLAALKAFALLAANGQNAGGP